MGPKGRIDSAYVEWETLTILNKLGSGTEKRAYKGRWADHEVAVVHNKKGGICVEGSLLQTITDHPNLVHFWRWGGWEKDPARQVLLHEGKLCCVHACYMTCLVNLYLPLPSSCPYRILYPSTIIDCTNKVGGSC